MELEDGVGLDEGDPMAYEVGDGVGFALGIIQVRDCTGEAVVGDDVGDDVGDNVGEAEGVLLSDELGDAL